MTEKLYNNVWLVCACGNETEADQTDKETLLCNLCHRIGCWNVVEDEND